MHLQSIHIHPLKSARGLAIDEAEVGKRGLAGDRRWMVVDGTGKFISARTFPGMVLIDATLAPGGAGIVLEAPGHPRIEVAEPAPGQATVDVEVWQSHCPARAADDAAHAWISTVLQQPCRLVHMSEDCLRAVSSKWSRRGDIVSFADGFPLLLIGTASLDELNRRASRPQSMLQFRPNLVVRTGLPFIEDRWQRIRIGSVDFDVSKPCVRCVLTTVDPATGIKASDGEPLTTLKQFRRSDLGITFGQNLIPRGRGMLRRNDEVFVLGGTDDEQLL